MIFSKTFVCPVCGKETNVHFYELSANLCECRNCLSSLDVAGEKTRFFGLLYGIAIAMSFVVIDLVEKAIYPWFVANRPVLVVEHKKFTIDLISSGAGLSFAMFCVLLIPLFELNNATEIRKITKRNFKRKYRVAIAVFFTVFYVLLLLFATLVPIYYLIFV
ncbi:MAG: hypothetical protein ACOX2F_03205 [bacterium]